MKESESRAKEQSQQFLAISGTSSRAQTLKAAVTRYTGFLRVPPLTKGWGMCTD